MTIDEAITHCEEIANSKCNNCGAEHKQLAEWLKDYKRLLEQEPCEDCISREQAIKCLECDFDITGRANMEVVVNYINSAHDKIMNLPNVKQEPCEDCISRANLIKRLQDHYDFFVNAYGGFQNLPYNDKSRVDEITNCIAEVVNMPSVQPKAKTGHWIMHERHRECSVCGVYLPKDMPRNSYCPNCGCKMEDKE